MKLLRQKYLALSAVCNPKESIYPVEFDKSIVKQYLPCRFDEAIVIYSIHHSPGWVGSSKFDKVFTPSSWMKPLWYFLTLSNWMKRAYLFQLDEAKKIKYLPCRVQYESIVTKYMPCQVGESYWDLQYFPGWEYITVEYSTNI